ncbi:MAG: hypothetical protein ACREKH_05450 [Candidatus Rokuibacteriota bacterium]
MKVRLDGQALALGQNYTFEVDGEYPPDFLGYLEPIGTYEELLPHAETVAIAGRPTHVIGLHDLIRIKAELALDGQSRLDVSAFALARFGDGIPR